MKPISKNKIIQNAAAIELYKIQPPLAPDNLLEEYRDFGKYRWFIDLAQYDEKLMLRMAIMLRDNLEKQGKINRRDLFSSLRKMAARIPNKLITNPELSDVLFEIFERLIISNRHNFSKTCLPGYHQAIDSVLKKVLLSDEAVDYLIKNIDLSFRIANRIIRYPAINIAISKWAKENINTDCYRYQRIRMTALMLNADPDYVLPMQLIEEDHSYFNQFDIKAFAEAKKDVQMRRIYKGYNGPFIGETEESNEDLYFFIEEEWHKPYSSYGEQNLTEQDFYMDIFSKTLRNRIMWRYYNWTSNVDADMDRFIENMNMQFNKEKNTIYNVVRMYAIRHSHLDSNTKAELFKKLYLETKNDYIIKIAAKSKNTAFLKWMMQQQE